MYIVFISRVLQRNDLLLKFILPHFLASSGKIYVESITLPSIEIRSGLQLRLKVLRRKDSRAGPVGVGVVVDVVELESAAPESGALPERKLSIRLRVTTNKTKSVRIFTITVLVMELSSSATGTPLHNCQSSLLTEQS